MPIYAYRCEECGFAKDVLQKMSDDPLSNCPSCGKSSFKKQVTAAGFQLKGSGWYVTDFRGGSGATAPAANSEPNAAASSGTESGKSSGTDAGSASTTGTAGTSSATSTGNPTSATPTSTS